MNNKQMGIILVGHGGIPKDYPQELVTKLKRLEAQRRASGGPMSKEELELDTKIRTWPRTSKTDPYQAGLESLATHFKPLLNGAQFALAYNEFCGPTLSEAIEDLNRQGSQKNYYRLNHVYPRGFSFGIRNSRRIAGTPCPTSRCDPQLRLAL